MPIYVDGFVIPLPKKNLAAYRRIARVAGKVWMEHGALSFRECVGDDLAVHCGVPFTKLVKLKKGETVLFSYIEYRSKAHRDRVNRKVMADPRLTSLGCDMPFDMKRMTNGGFKAIVEMKESR